MHSLAIKYHIIYIYDLGSRFLWLKNEDYLEILEKRKTIIIYKKKIQFPGNNKEVLLSAACLCCIDPQELSGIWII
jgi:hypothetical protein